MSCFAHNDRIFHMTPPYISKNKTLFTHTNKYVLMTDREDDLDFIESLIFD